MTVEQELDEAKRGWSDALQRMATITIVLHEHVEFWRAKVVEAEKLLRKIRETDDPYTAEAKAFLDSLFPLNLPAVPTISLPQGPSSGSAPCSHFGHRS
jgi:hypothetical protein